MSVSGGLASMIAGSVAAQTQAERTASQDKRLHMVDAAKRAADSKEKVLKAERLSEAQSIDPTEQSGQSLDLSG